MRRITATLSFGLLMMGGLLASPEAEAGARGARKALEELEEGRRPYDAVMNRFFLKEDRFEIAPIIGYVPNNPMVRRYTGGILGAYHFSETFAAEGAFIYAPDLNTQDLKGLVNTLVVIAQDGSSDGSAFQQPVDKLALGATFAARWAPIYGKINLIGETVLNFDFYGVAGLGLLTINKYYARYDPTQESGLRLDKALSKSTVPLNIGLGFNFFINQSVAFKIDARSYLYIDDQPQYDQSVDVTEQRPYNNLITSGGISIFFPKMQPRIQDF
jgi:outer membrane beta-barrel protein